MYTRPTSKTITVVTGTDTNGNPITESVTVVNAFLDPTYSTSGMAEELVGNATFRIAFSDTNGTNYPTASTYCTTVVPSDLLAMFRRVTSNQSNQTEIDQVCQVLINSPEANAIIPGADPNSVPNVDGFMAALEADALSPTGTTVPDVLSFLPYFQMYFLDPPTRKAKWALIVAKPASWLTSPMITFIENLAAQYNLPLV